MEENLIVVEDKNGKKYTVRPIDLSLVSEIETPAKRGFKFFGRVARTFKEIPERMKKWYESKIDYVQGIKDKNFIKKDLEAMEKVITKNKDELNALIRGERAILERKLDEVNLDIEDYTNNINSLEEEDSKLKQDDTYRYYLSNINGLNQELTKLKILLKSLEKQHKEFADSNRTNPQLDEEISNLKVKQDELAKEKNSLEKAKDKYLAANGLFDNLPTISKLKQARADLNESVSKLNSKIDMLKNTTVDNIADILPDIDNTKIQKLYQTIEKQKNLRDMRIKEQEELLKNINVGKPKEDIQGNPSESDPTNDILASVAAEMSADLSAIEGQSLNSTPTVDEFIASLATELNADLSAIEGQSLDSTPTSAIETVSNDVDFEQATAEPMIQQSQFTEEAELLNPIYVPSFNPDESVQEQEFENGDNIQPVVAEIPTENDKTSESSEKINNDDNMTNISEKIEEESADSISWDDFSETSKASELVTKFQKSLADYADSTITIVQNIFMEMQKHNQEQLDRINASYQKVVSDNNALKQELNVTKEQNISLMQTNASMVQSINERYTPNETVNRMQSENAESLSKKDEIINSTQVENKNLKQQLSDSQKENTTLKEDNSVKSQRINDLEQSNNAKDEEMKSLNDGLADLTQKNNTLLLENQTLRKQIEAIYTMLQSSALYAQPVTAEYQSQPEATVAEGPKKK